MGDFSNKLCPMATIHPWSLESCTDLDSMNATRLASIASAVYPVANRAIFVPFSISVPITVVQMFAYNGSTASGNTDVGIYTDEGGTTHTLVRIVSIGSTAQAGTSDLQAFNIADTVLLPGNYYMAINHDDVTGTFRRSLFLDNTIELIGIRQSNIGAIALPATVTAFVIPGSPYLPLFGLSMRALL